jgi:quercetin dioxygenase-like cupin family protein
MKKTKMIVTSFITSLLLLGLTTSPMASAAEYVTKAKGKTLYQAPLPGMDGKEMIVKHFSFPPNFVGGKHKHPGSVFVYVLEGEFTVMLADGTKTFKAGDIYAEKIDSPMVAKNMSSSDDVKLLVFQVGDIGEPMMIKVTD